MSFNLQGYRYVRLGSMSDRESVSCALVQTKVTGEEPTYKN